MASLLLSACGGGAPAPEPEPEASRTLPAVSPEAVSPAAEAEAARLLQTARTALEGGSPERALELARRVVESHPGAPGASEGLWIVARAARASGENGLAAQSAERFAELLPGGHPLLPAVRLLRARALAGQERWEDAARTYLTVSPGAADSVRTAAADGLAAVAPELSFRTLELLMPGEAAPESSEMVAPLLAEYALALHARDRTEEARRRARAALDAGARGPVADLARSVLDGRVTVERRRAAALGAILPQTGSPGEQQYARLIHEGIRARMETDDRRGRLPVSLLIRDDSGSVGTLARLVPELQGRDAAGIVGPLTSRTLEAAAAARSEPFPLVSPTAGRDPDGFEAVYSLGAPDPGGADALARFAADQALDSAIVIHADSEEFRYEADTFIRAYEERGGRVMRRIPYEPGSTFFEDAFRTVQELLPAALVLPVPAGDIELIAPQITYFGLDTLGVRVLGTEGWGDPGVVETVSPRHTDGVVLATPRRPGGEAPGWADFVRDYETVLQKTLRSRIPALGYDAAGLLLQALATGVRGPEEVRDALEAVEGYEGATGTLSVRDGRIVRRYHLVRLREREMIPVRLEGSEAVEE